ncbi:MAG: hypothetical protein AAFV62_00210 [Pseudomonadota bacterium]
MDQETPDVEMQEDELISERPSAEFVDGFLAGLAVSNAAASGEGAAALFYSFEWIGDGEEERDHAIFGALQGDAQGMALAFEEVADWRQAVEQLARRWLTLGLPQEAEAPIAAEFLDLMSAFLADDELEVFRVVVTPAPGRDEIDPPIGAAFDHLLFETADGRVLMEFSRAA